MRPSRQTHYEGLWAWYRSGWRDVGDANAGIGITKVSGAGLQVNIAGEITHLRIGAASAALSAEGEGTVNIKEGVVVRLAGAAATFVFTAVGSLPATCGTLFVGGAGSRLIGGDVVAIAIAIAIAIISSLIDAVEGNDVDARSGSATARNGGRIESELGDCVGEAGTLSDNGGNVLLISIMVFPSRPRQSHYQRRTLDR